MKKIFVLMICVLTSQNANAAEIRAADIEYRYEGPVNSGSLSHSYMIREQEIKRIKLTKKSIKFSQPNDVKPAQEIQLAETENKTIFEETVKIKASQLFPKYFIFFKNLPSSGGMIDCLMWQ
jgi:hypothetical protein